MLEITIKGSPNEIAELVVKAQIQLLEKKPEIESNEDLSIRDRFNCPISQQVKNQIQDS